MSSWQRQVLRRLWQYYTAMELTIRVITLRIHLPPLIASLYFRFPICYGGIWIIGCRFYRRLYFHCFTWSCMCSFFYFFCLNFVYFLLRQLSSVIPADLICNESWMVCML